MAINWTWPFAEIKISDRECTIRYPCGKIILGKDEIVAVLPYGGFFSKGIRINHSNKSMPQEVVFWTRNAQEISELLAPSVKE